MELSLFNLVSWKPMEEPEEGYTVVIACMQNLVEIAIANVALISRMNLPKMKELIVVFDVTEDNFSYQDQILEAAGDLPIQIVHYSPKQEAVGKRFSWGWTYAWISWTKAISLVKTKHVLLHDLDAMAIDKNLFENLYNSAVSHNSSFQGILWYTNINNIVKDDGFVRTFEMVLDAQELRQRFRPFNAFNKVMRHKDRFVVMDTFLYIQSRTGNCRVESISDESYVHPSQLISQYTDWLKNRKSVRYGDSNPYFNMPLLPVYLYLGGRPEPLQELIDCLGKDHPSSLTLMGKEIDFSGLSSQHWNWLIQQAEQLSDAFYEGNVPPDIKRYCDLLNARFNSCPVGTQPDLRPQALVA
jgi:hypothetical protein